MQTHGFPPGMAPNAGGPGGGALICECGSNPICRGALG